MAQSDETESATIVRLYTQEFNPYSEKVAATLALTGLAFERIISEEPEDVARLSPIVRTLPVLEIAGRRKADSVKIMKWLDELYPTPTLFRAQRGLQPPRTSHALSRSSTPYDCARRSRSRIAVSDVLRLR